MVSTFLIAFFFLDPVNGEEWKALDDGLKYGSDMVKLIRDHFENYFTICVAGILLSSNLYTYEIQLYKD